MFILYIVATPIGNLEDITLRALRVLKEVDVILCEDTRTTKKLLQKYGIDTPMISYHAHSKLSKVEKIFALLLEGKNLALVSDAGTPTISDPGVLLVSQIKEKFGDEVKIVPIPGPSAVIAALSASGIPSSSFLFLGFLPHKKGREKIFRSLASLEHSAVFYESPHRLMKTLTTLAEKYPVRHLVVGREMTKIHEEFITGTTESVAAHFSRFPETVRGECVLILAPRGWKGEKDTSPREENIRV